MDTFIDICNTLFLYGIISSWCTTPVVQHPEEGTVLQSSCSGTTLIETIADGKGGSIQSLTGNSEQCGYTPPVPEAGTLLKSGCSKDYLGVKWFQYADGEGGTYVEKDPRSYECGFRRYLNLSMEKEYGDRFDPAIVKVDYKDMLGRDEPWGMVHHSTTIGSAIRVGQDTVEIYGDGGVGTGIFTLGTQEIQYTIDPEPVCEVYDRVDCVGYENRSRQNFIYYGEDDNTLVTWELGIVEYASHNEYGDDVPIEILDEYAPDSSQWKKWERKVQQYNEIYANSGVHIEFKLTKVYLGHWHSTRELDNITTGLPVDIVLGYGTSYPKTCGVANVNTIFVEGQPPASMSRCNIYTDLHEIGHSVGLAHGPENQAWQQTGYIFPEFGHGWNDICGRYDDLMSYGSSGIFHSNSLLACNEVTRDKQTKPAGDRQWSDTAYSLNRVRFDVSLVHNERAKVDNSALKPIQSRARYIKEEVID